MSSKNFEPSQHIPPFWIAGTPSACATNLTFAKGRAIAFRILGGVKAALNRGRSKLESLQGRPQAPTQAPRFSTPGNKQILQLYVDRFNSRDWDGLRELISADARLLIADRYSGSFAAGGYLGVYSRMKQTWRLTMGEVDGEPSIILLNERNGEWEIEGIASNAAFAASIAGVGQQFSC